MHAAAHTLLQLASVVWGKFCGCTRELSDHHAASSLSEPSDLSELLLDIPAAVQGGEASACQLAAQHAQHCSISGSSTLLMPSLKPSPRPAISGHAAAPSWSDLHQTQLQQDDGCVLVILSIGSCLGGGVSGVDDLQVLLAVMRQKRSQRAPRHQGRL